MSQRQLSERTHSTISFRASFYHQKQGVIKATSATHRYNSVLTFRKARQLFEDFGEIGLIDSQILHPLR